MNAQQTFRFRAMDNIGVAEAESDLEFLKDSFVNTGELAALRDCSATRCVVLGRTGAGKTALLLELKRVGGDRVIEVKPEELALSYISNSSILRYISEELRVNLDPFFKLLWRHVFVVELIKRRFKVDSEADRQGLIARIGRFFSGPSDKEQKWKRALAYLEKHGPSFWLETDVRIKEVTQKLEQSLEGSLEIGPMPSVLPTASAKASSTVVANDEIRAEHIQRAQRVVNDIQIRELSEILDLLDAVLDDPQKPYYLVVDRLDESWVEDRIRYQLIRALLETARDFYKIRNAKLVLALRKDLLDRVFQRTRGPGFQEEKYQSQFLTLNWRKAELVDLLDARIAHLVKRRYTNAIVTHKDLLPRSVDGEDSVDFIVRRTLMRPRDMISFFNKCIERSEGSPSISQIQMREAEGAYSRDRLRSLADEWHSDYPNLLRFVDVLKKRSRQFRLASLTDDECAAFCNAMVSEHLALDPLQTAAYEMGGSESDCSKFRQGLAYCFYLTGLIGLKLETFEKVSWAGNERSVSLAEISDEITIAIHPCFWRALGTKS